jgi:hypothetical protein
MVALLPSRGQFQSGDTFVQRRVAARRAIGPWIAELPYVKPVYWVVAKKMAA